MRERSVDFTNCPECGGTAEIRDHAVLESTDAPVEHAGYFVFAAIGSSCPSPGSKPATTGVWSTQTDQARVTDHGANSGVVLPVAFVHIVLGGAARRAIWKRRWSGRSIRLRRAASASIMARVGSEFEELVAEADRYRSMAGNSAGSTAGRPSTALVGLSAADERVAWPAAESCARHPDRRRRGARRAGAGAFRRQWRPPSRGRRTWPWPPALLHPRGVVVVPIADEPPLPFADEAFDLVTSRHPAHRVVDGDRPRAAPAAPTSPSMSARASVFELVEWFLGPQPSRAGTATPGSEPGEAPRRRAARWSICACERLRMEFFDIGAVVYFLRKVIWAVPGFTVDRYLPALRRLHERIEADGHFLAHSSRTLIEARKPDSGAVGIDARHSDPVISSKQPVVGLAGTNRHTVVANSPYLSVKDACRVMPR